MTQCDYEDVREYDEAQIRDAEIVMRAQIDSGMWPTWWERMLLLVTSETFAHLLRNPSLVKFERDIHDADHFRYLVESLSFLN